MFWSRLAISVADASFWLLIIGGSGLTIWLVFRGVVGYLLGDIKMKKGEEEEE